MKILLKALFKFLFKVKVNNNLLNLNYDKLIITPNHVSFLDAALIALFLPFHNKRPVFAVYTEIYKHWTLRLASKYVDLVPIDSVNPYTLKTLVKVVNEGKPLVIFPEGRLTTTGSLMKIYNGTAFIAARTGATIVPVWIDGVEFSVLNRLKGILKRRLFPKLTINVLEAETLTMPQDMATQQCKQVLGEELHKILMNARFNSRNYTTLSTAFLNAVDVHASKKPFLKDITLEELNYKQLIKKIIALSTLLKNHLQDSQKVGVLLPNANNTVATLFALLVQGKVPAMLNYTLGLTPFKQTIEVASLKHIVTSKQFLEKAKLSYLVDEITEVKWIFLEDLQQAITFQHKLIIIFKSIFPQSTFNNPAIKPDDEAIILFTSGSEGIPKGVVHTHTSILANIEQLRCVIDIMKTDKYLLALPIFHAFGITVGLFLPLVTGGQIFLYHNPLHYKVIPEIIYDQNCTILIATPTFLGNYAKYAHPYDFRLVRYVVSGAEKLPPPVKELWINKFSLRILEGYGVTECGPVISINVPMTFKPNTVGRALPGIQTRLIKMTGINEGGILQVKGPNLMKGYLLYGKSGIQLTNAINQNGEKELGWYDTGDIVDIDQEDFIEIKGRFKRFAKIAGEMVSLESVEKVFNKSLTEASNAIINMDSGKGEMLVLFSTQQDLTTNQLVQIAKQEGLSMLAVPKQIIYLKELPLLGSGKFDIVQLKNIYTEMTV